MKSRNRVAELREMTNEELVNKISEDKSFLITLKYRHSIMQIESPARIRSIRREVAKAYTILRERELKGEKI